MGALLAFAIEKSARRKSFVFGDGLHSSVPCFDTAYSCCYSVLQYAEQFKRRRELSSEQDEVLRPWHTLVRLIVSGVHDGLMDITLKGNKVAVKSMDIIVTLPLTERSPGRQKVLVSLLGL